MNWYNTADYKAMLSTLYSTYLFWEYQLQIEYQISNLVVWCQHSYV